MFCPHCQTDVAERTYRLHKNIYYSEESNTWKRIHENGNSACSPAKRKIETETQPIEPCSQVRFNIEMNNYCEFEEFDNETIAQNDYTTIGDVKLDPISSYVQEKLEETWEDVTFDEISIDIRNAQTRNVTLDNIGPRRHVLELSHWLILFISSWSTAYNIPMTAIGYLLLFIHAFMTVCGAFSPALATLADIIPSSVYSLKKAQGNLEDDFIKYVVCPKCHKLYALQSTFKSNKIPCCTFVKYPGHTQRKFRTPCGTPLYKEIIVENQMKVFYPVKTYCYKSIRSSLMRFLDRKGFKELCNLWKTRVIVPGTYRDVYDGRVWKEFRVVKSTPFLDNERNYGFILNVDWFQPFKHSPYSVGVIYLALLNLPRSERYKPENIIITGIIPGPDEPSKDINTYIKPLVEELEVLWNDGFEYKGHGDDKPENYHAALLCCACDIPAARKLCGFMGHSAKSGCSKCKKQFKTGKFGEKIDYGGFEICQPRTDIEHRQTAAKISKQTSITKQQELESKFGVRYTSLMDLSYYDCIAFTIIDPMHNLFLGTAKYMFKTIWNERLDRTALEQIQEIVDDMVVPTSLGQIPRKINALFSNFTSDQWKNWTLYFSPIALKDKLQKKDFECWMLFVNACRILAAPTITLQRLREGHEQLVSFCRTFETLYGSTKVTPNMHLHTHLIQCIIDYGPVHSFWLFSFERMNGILGSFHTNQRSIEMQLMRRLTHRQNILACERPTLFQDMFESAFAFNSERDEVQQRDATIVLRAIRLSSGKVVVDTDWCLDADVKLLGSKKSLLISDFMLESLRKAVAHCFDICTSQVTGSCYKYLNMEMLGEKYGSSDSRLSRSSVILASWCGVDGEINVKGDDIRPGIVRFFITFFLDVDGSKKRMTFAVVNWMQRVSHQHSLCPGVEVWCHKLFEPEGPSSFIPVQRILSKCVCATVRIKNEILLAVIPHIRHIYW